MTLSILASARTQIADYLSTLIYVYTLLIVLFIVIQLLFSVGRAPAYSRALDMVVGFLRDVCEPFLRIFRRCRAPVRGHRLQPDPRDPLAVAVQQHRRAEPHPRLAGMPPSEDGRRRLQAAPVESLAPRGAIFLIVFVADQLEQARGPQPRSSRAKNGGVLPGIAARRHAQQRRRLRPLSRQPGRCGASSSGSRWWRCSSTSQDTPSVRLIWLPTGMLVGGALGNILDRISDGSVTDFIKLPLGWPPFNLADSSIVVAIADPDDPARAPAERIGVDEPFTIAYEDEHLLVIDKGAGVVVHPARGHREGTLSQLLAPMIAGGDPERAGIVHRLDRDTSGPARRLAHRGGPPAAPAGARRAADRARVPRARRGEPARTHGDRSMPDRPRPARAHAHGRRRRARARGAHALHARARLPGRVAAAAAPGDRAHPSDPRTPAGDRPSRCPATRSTARAGLLGLERQFLHSTRLAFTHPLTGEPIDVRSPLPEDLARRSRSSRTDCRGEREGAGRGRAASAERHRPAGVRLSSSCNL